jgi:hypothetical protein
VKSNSLHRTTVLHLRLVRKGTLSNDLRSVDCEECAVPNDWVVRSGMDGFAGIARKVVASNETDDL